MDFVDKSAQFRGHEFRATESEAAGLQTPVDGQAARRGAGRAGRACAVIPSTGLGRGTARGQATRRGAQRVAGQTAAGGLGGHWVSVCLYIL